MEVGQSCFFIGHREADMRLLPRLEAVVERLVPEENVRFFYVGCYGGFDRIAAAAVKKVKRIHPEVLLMRLLAYHPAERPVEMPDGYDGTYYPEGMENTPRRFGIVKANRSMVNCCQWMVCYVGHGASNAQNILRYAQYREKKGLIKIENIFEK